jgi:hypothetical protein
MYDSGIVLDSSLPTLALQRKQFAWRAFERVSVEIIPAIIQTMLAFFAASAAKSAYRIRQAVQSGSMSYQ